MRPSLSPAYISHASDHDGRIVRNESVVVAGIPQTLTGWVLGNAQRDQTDDNIRNGLLWKYVGATRIYRCPSDTSKVRGHPELLRFRSYGLDGALNNYYGAGTGQMFDQPGILRKDLETLNPAKSYAFLDLNEKSIDCSDFEIFVSNINPPPTVRLSDFAWAHLPGERHANGANLSFLDGHVEGHRWLYTPKKPIANVPTWQAPVNDLDRKDLQWVVENNAWWHWLVKKNGFPPKWP